MPRAITVVHEIAWWAKERHFYTPKRKKMKTEYRETLHVPQYFMAFPRIVRIGSVITV